jgi:hypothetical protein
MEVPWRRVSATLAVVALIGVPPLTAQTAPTHDIKGVGVSKESPAIEVPDQALTVPATPGGVSGDPLADAEPLLPAAPAGSVPGSSTPAALDSSGIPVRALDGYRRAALLVGSADPGCHIDWALVAAIGRVESNHARFGGSQLDSAGVARPAIIGIPLDGSHQTARITDSDGGRLDHDSVYDRAVGPMQFIPSTWLLAGVDADGDGVKDPQNMADAATATAVYLCSGNGDLRRPGDLRAAILRYNASDSYVRMVTAIASGYRGRGIGALEASALFGTTQLPSGSLQPATPTKPLTARPGSAPAKLAGGKPAAGHPSSTPATVPQHQPAATPGAPPAVPPASAPVHPPQIVPVPPVQIPTAPKPPVPPPPVPPGPPVPPAPVPPAPVPPVPCQPDPTAPPTAGPTAGPTAAPPPCLTPLTNSPSTVLSDPTVTALL